MKTFLISGVPHPFTYELFRLLGMSPYEGDGIYRKGSVPERVTFLYQNPNTRAIKSDVTYHSDTLVRKILESSIRTCFELRMYESYVEPEKMYEINVGGKRYRAKGLSVDLNSAFFTQIFQKLLKIQSRKFYLRAYMFSLVKNSEKKTKIKTGFADFGLILLSELPYVEGRPKDDRIHEPSLSSTPRNMFFPEDFPYRDMAEDINSQLALFALLVKNFTSKNILKHISNSYQTFEVLCVLNNCGRLKVIEVTPATYTLKSMDNKSASGFMYKVALWHRDIVQKLI